MTLTEIRTRLALADARETNALRDMQAAQYRNDPDAHERAFQEMLAAQNEIDVLERAERAAKLKEE